MNIMSKLPNNLANGSKKLTETEKIPKLFEGTEGHTENRNVVFYFWLSGTNFVIWLYTYVYGYMLCFVSMLRVQIADH